MIDSRTEQTEHGALLTLYGDATVQNASEIKDIIIGKLNEGGVLTLDLSYVTDCDISLLQLVCAAHRRYPEDTLTILMGGFSPAVYEAASASGFLMVSGCQAGRGDEGCLWHCLKAGV